MNLCISSQESFRMSSNSTHDRIKLGKRVKLKEENSNSCEGCIIVGRYRIQKLKEDKTETQ